MAETGSINVTVLVADTRRDDLSGVVNDLKDEGFVLKESLDAIGVITGSVPTAAFAKLRKVPGVSAVERERTDYRPQTGDAGAAPL